VYLIIVFDQRYKILLRHSTFNLTLVGKFDLEEGYNIEPAKLIKPGLNGTLLSVVGGFRKLSHMEEVIEKGYSDLISMSRPFIREPGILNKFREGKTDTVSCQSCNKCLAAVANGIPVRCFRNGSGN
jgi:2,4-dienoyl-CoA reductase-like NADH-dependent reductase (Old Yellow Enzyme family)